MLLETWSPISGGPRGFPRKSGVAYLPKEALRRAFLDAALAYAVRRDEGFAAEVRRLVQHGYKGDARGLAEAMLEALLEREPELDAIRPDDLPLEGVRPRRVLRLDLLTGRAEEAELELFEGVLPWSGGLPQALETWLAAATRSYAEALASAEAGAVVPLWPEAEGAYHELKARVLKREPWPLRVGYWTPEGYGGTLLALARLGVEGVLERRFRARPLPRRVCYLPKDRRTLGWLVLRKERT